MFDEPRGLIDGQKQFRVQHLEATQRYYPPYDQGDTLNHRVWEAMKQCFQAAKQDIVTETELVSQVAIRHPMQRDALRFEIKRLLFSYQLASSTSSSTSISVDSESQSTRYVKLYKVRHVYENNYVIIKPEWFVDPMDESLDE